MRRLAARFTREGLPSKELFRFVYSRLAQRGKTDAPGGAEYRRIFRLWLHAGKPIPITPFILRHV